MRPASVDSVIRRAVVSDVPAMHRLLADLSREIGYGAQHRGDPNALREHGFGQAPLFRAQIAEREGRAVGLALYFPEFSTLRGAPGTYVQDLYVAAESRGAHLGARLLGAVVRDAADWRAAYLRLTAHRTNSAALAFYVNLGFRGDPNEHPLMLEGVALQRAATLR